MFALAAVYDFIDLIAQIAREVFEKRGLSAYDEKTGKGLLRHFVGRSSRKGELLLGIVVNGKGIPAGYTVADEIKKRERLMHRLVARHEDYPAVNKKTRIVGIVQNSNTARGNVIMGSDNTTLFGTPQIREKLGGFEFRLQLLSFFQVNPSQAARMYSLIKEYAQLSPAELAVDAFAGIGPIAFYLASQAAEVIGIEERKEAVRDAEANIRLNKLSNVKMIAGAAEKVFPKKADVVVLDPPRGGCSEKALQLTTRSSPRTIVYVSCNPETLARDLKDLTQAGYRIEIVQPVDMFPQTEHVEVVVKLSRG